MESEQSEVEQRLREVLQTIKEKHPEIVENCYLVGSWVWAEFKSAPAQEVRDFLREVGFRWNKTRKAWQNAAGNPRTFASTEDPRKTYPIVNLR